MGVGKDRGPVEVGRSTCPVFGPSVRNERGVHGFRLTKSGGRDEVRPYSGQ